MNQLALFAKYWSPGQVKTRLADTIGPQQAAGFHRTCLQTLLHQFRHVADLREIVYAPPERRQEFAELASTRWAMCPQSEGDLGQRMASYLQTAFDQGADRVVLLGADSPTLPPESVCQAFELLERHDIVVARAEDGGYCLLGASRFLPEIFTNIAWGQTNVWHQTQRQLDIAHARWTTIRGWFDVDHLEDLHRLRQELASPCYADAAWSALRSAAASICRCF